MRHRFFVEGRAAWHNGQRISYRPGETLPFASARLRRSVPVSSPSSRSGSDSLRWGGDSVSLGRIGPLRGPRGGVRACERDAGPGGPDSSRGGRPCGRTSSRGDWRKRDASDTSSRGPRGATIRIRAAWGVPPRALARRRSVRPPCAGSGDAGCGVLARLQTDARSSLPRRVRRPDGHRGGSGAGWARCLACARRDRVDSQRDSVHRNRGRAGPLRRHLAFSGGCSDIRVDRSRQ